MTDPLAWEGFVADPLSREDHPFRLLELPRSAVGETRRILTAVVRVQRRGVPPEKAERARAILTDPERLAVSDLGKKALEGR